MNDHPLFGAVGLSILLALPAAPDDGLLGIGQLYRLDRLARFRESVKVASVSSYDRTGGKNEKSEAQGFDLTNIICERTE